MGFEIEQEVSAGDIPEMSHLVAYPFGRPAFRFRPVLRPGWLWRTVGAGPTLALEPGLEEPRDPVKGRGGGLGPGLVDLAGMLLTHDGDGGGGGGGWRQ